MASIWCLCLFPSTSLERWGRNDYRQRQILLLEWCNLWGRLATASRQDCGDWSRHWRRRRRTNNCGWRRRRQWGEGRWRRRRGCRAQWHLFEAWEREVCRGRILVWRRLGKCKPRETLLEPILYGFACSEKSNSENDGSSHVLLIGCLVWDWNFHFCFWFSIFRQFCGRKVSRRRKVSLKCWVPMMKAVFSCPMYF